MALHDSNDVDAAIDDLLKQCSQTSSSPSSEVEDDVWQPSARAQTRLKDTQNECSSLPPSPEIGMARAGEGDISDADLDLKEDDEADPKLSGVPDNSEKKSENDATLTDNGEDQGIRQSPIHHTRQSSPESNRRSSQPTGAQIVTLTATQPPMRRSARSKSTLVYDQKYHPMDDAIRPSQASKRRILHGERPVLLKDSDASSSEYSGSDTGVVTYEEYSEEDEESQQPTRGRKRKRSRSRSLEPTRRSSRRRTQPKMSYNMKIHPQDSDLQRAYGCDGSKSSPSPNKREGCSVASASREGVSRKWCEKSSDRRDDSFGALSPEPLPQPLFAKEPTSKPYTKLCDTYPNLSPDVAYLAGRKGVWPDAKGLPFHIFEDRMEERLHAEAEAASPLHDDDDDKENDVMNPELLPMPNPLDGISIIPASHYRQQAEHYTLPNRSPMASNAFYLQPLFEATPYGLGWSDGAHDTNSSETRNCPQTDYMRTLASSENTPRLSSSTAARSGNDTECSSPPKSPRQLELLR